MKALHRIFRVLTCFPVVLSLLLCPLLPLKALIPAAFAQALPSKKATQTEAAEA